MSRLIEFPVELCGNVIFFKNENSLPTPLWFVLDTGAYISVIDRSVVEQLRLETRPIYENRTDREPMEHAAWANVGSLTIPGVNPDHPFIETKPLRHLEEYWGRRIDGLVGGDVFYQRVVEIDYDRKTVSFDEWATPEGRDNWQIVPITTDHRFMSIYEDTSEGRLLRWYTSAGKPYMLATIVLPPPAAPGIHSRTLSGSAAGLTSQESQDLLM